MCKIKYFLGENLTKWKTHLDTVLNAINFTRKTYRNYNDLLVEYFTSFSPVIPQSLEQLYKFKVGDKVLIDIPPSTRKNLGFKWSLQYGKFIIMVFYSTV